MIAEREKIKKWLQVFWAGTFANVGKVLNFNLKSDLS